MEIKFILILMMMVVVSSAQECNQGTHALNGFDLQLGLVVAVVMVADGVAWTIVTRSRYVASTMCNCLIIKFQLR